MSDDMIRGLGVDRAETVSAVLPDGLIVIDADEIIRTVNARAEQITGLRTADLVGRPVREALLLQDPDGHLWWDIADPWHGLGIRTGHREKLLMLPNGREVLATAAYVRSGPDKPVVTVLVALRDAEARRRAEADSAALVATVAHELRSPLTGVQGFSSTLLRNWEKFTDDQKRLMIETIEADAGRVTRLIIELLDVSRIHAGKLDIHPQPLDVSAVFANQVARQVAAGEDPSRFVVAVDDELPETWADPDRLEQIVTNLVVNACHHGRGTVRLGARAGTHRDAPSLDIVVSDDGPGIPVAHRELIFSRFWRGESRVGTGLGLYLVRGFAEAHGGAVVAEDSPTGGAQLRVSLPAGVPDFMR